jgi:predicted peptidase
MKTKHALLLLCCLAPCLSPLQAQRRPGPNDGGKIQRLPQALEAKTLSLNPEYYVFGLPAKGFSGKLPLLIYLHGAGGVGSDINKASRQAGSLLGPLKEASINTLVVAPQATKSPRKEGAKGGWQVGDLDILLGHLLKSLPVDPDRVYLTGNSMGGYGTFMWAGCRPDHFAAIAPMVGGLGPLGPKDVTKDLALWGRNIATLPMRAYFGANDRVVPPDRGEMILKEITQAGGKQAKVIILPDMGHNAGKVPHGDPAFYQWLYGNKRK